MSAPSLNLPHNSMENFRQKNKCSFPSMPIQDDELEFEFGSITSPCSQNSPADNFFLNGRLLPHDFSCPPANHTSILSRSTSRTSSFSSKDPLESSRSNSISSMSSSCSSSARTSTSDGFKRRMLINGRTKSASKTTVASKRPYQASRPVLMPQHGSQRWLFIAPAPVLSRKVSRRNRAECKVQEAAKAKKGVESKRNGSVRFWRRFFCWFVSACNECHAIKPSRRETIFEGKIESQ